MSERSQFNRNALSISLRIFVGIPMVAAIVVGGKVVTTNEGRGDAISECSGDYPGPRREVRVIDIDVLNVLATAAKAGGIEDEYASGGISKDIATLDGELACYKNTADEPVGANILLLPAGLKALHYVKGDFSSSENPFNTLPPGLFEVTS